MTPTPENLHPDDDPLFDLLVDGELDEAARSELLSGLDERTDGWRKCALAFLESQLFGEGLSGLVRRPEPAPAVRPEARRSWPPRYLGTVLAMAASFLVALSLGILLRSAWRAEQPSGAPAFNAIADSGPAAETDFDQAQRPEQPQAPEMPSSPVQMVTLGDPDGSGRSIQIPVTERRNLDEKWLKSLPAPMPSKVTETLRRSGLEVRHRRVLIPLRMKDGRRLVVPVDEIDVRRIGNPAL